MTPLDIRCQYAMARVVQVYDRLEGDDLMVAAFEEALALGRHTFVADEDRAVPVFFADVAALQAAWTQGWLMARASAEMAECSRCHNLNGDPCPWHG